MSHAGLEGYRRLLCVFCLVLTGAGGTTLTEAPILKFVDVTQVKEITWRHVNGATEEKFLIETMGGGGGFLDYNRDGRLDLYLVDSGCHRFSGDCVPAGNALYRQNADGTFTDVTTQAGVAGGGYGMGVAVGDYNNDGYQDLYVTNVGPNQLFRNNGDGTFTDVTAESGTGDPHWGTSAAFFDYNRDGLLDLFVANYLTWDYDPNPFCGERRPGYRSYCHPDLFLGIASRLYRNNGDGTFTDVSEASGIALAEGKALGVVAFDFNRDGWLDLYVANDAVRNFLFRNNGDGTFEEIGLLAEVAYGFAGKPESGMGTDAGDFDGDGWVDLFVTNIDYEANNLHRNDVDGTFTDITVAAELGSLALLTSGFGTRFVDYDNDGDLDLVVLNGHVLDNIHLFREAVTFAERPFLLQNDGGRFAEVGGQHGQPFQELYVGRALATGDFDSDGDIDFLWVNNGQPPVLLRNDGGNARSWIGFELAGTASGRDAFGALVTLKASEQRQIRELVGGSSYCAAHDLRLLFGLDRAETVDEVTIHWPRGAVTTLKNLATRRYYRVEEPDEATNPQRRENQR